MLLWKSIINLGLVKKAVSSPLYEFTESKKAQT